tara:strand:- start:1358 stop:1525 length:168 start_codon:yes stop_codon:yes gene_type:complete
MSYKQIDALITSHYSFLFFLAAIESKSLAIAYLKTARHNKKQTNHIDIARKMLPE